MTGELDTAQLHLGVLGAIVDPHTRDLGKLGSRQSAQVPLAARLEDEIDRLARPYFRAIEPDLSVVAADRTGKIRWTALLRQRQHRDFRGRTFNLKRLGGVDEPASDLVSDRRTGDANRARSQREEGPLKDLDEVLAPGDDPTLRLGCAGDVRCPKSLNIRRPVLRLTLQPTANEWVEEGSNRHGYLLADIGRLGFNPHTHGDLFSGFRLETAGKGRRDRCGDGQFQGISLVNSAIGRNADRRNRETTFAQRSEGVFARELPHRAHCGREAKRRTVARGDDLQALELEVVDLQVAQTRRADFYRQNDSLADLGPLAAEGCLDPDVVLLAGKRRDEQ